MKNLKYFSVHTFIIVFVMIFFSDKSSAEDVCMLSVKNHLNIIENSDIFIKDLKKDIQSITSYQINLLQKNLTIRYASLKDLLKLYTQKDVNGFKCPEINLAHLMAIYDFSLLKKSIFNQNELRQIVLSFTKYPKYHLSDLVEKYEAYLKTEFIENIISNNSSDLQNALIKNINLSDFKLDYDPNLYKISDVTKKGTMGSIAGLARLWGLLSDRLKWRNGRLNNNQSALTLLYKNLKPFDLVFEKRNFTLSNFTIPGNWGHVGIWLGTKEELISLGIWERESFKPFKAFVESGKNIVEVRKEGVNYQSLETYINLDEIAITRIKGIEDRASEVIDNLAEQLDKKYDFKFNVHTIDKITCSEFITFSYGNIKWQETKTLFQKSLRPDDLAVLTLSNPDISEFVLYLRGQKNTSEVLNLGIDEWFKVITKSKKQPSTNNKTANEKKNDLIFSGG